MCAFSYWHSFFTISLEFGQKVKFISNLNENILKFKLSFFKTLENINLKKGIILAILLILLILSEFVSIGLLIAANVSCINQTSLSLFTGVNYGNKLKLSCSNFYV